MLCPTALSVCFPGFKKEIILLFAEPNIRMMSSCKQEESFYDDDDEYNPFKEDDPTQYVNPFDDADPEPETQAPVPDFAPQPIKRKNVRPVDMSKYLYAATSKTDEEELDE